MGFRKIAAITLTVICISCSKPGQETGGSKDSATTDAGNNSTSNSNENKTQVTLTAAEADRVADELFVVMHKGLSSNNNVVLNEEFSVDGNTFKYKIVIHNVDNFGLSSSSYDGTRPVTDEQVKAFEADTSADKEYPVGEPYTQTNYYYVNEIDTFYVIGDYTAYVDNPELTPRVLTIQLGGEGLIHRNAADVVDGVPKFSSKTYWYFNPMEGPVFIDTDAITVNMGQPLEFNTDELYLKAKIKELTDNDLSGLNKDQLAFIRNDIFAHHGHTFKTTRMVTHYQTLEWYHAVVDDAANLLNKFEKRNVEFIKKREV